MREERTCQRRYSNGERVTYCVRKPQSIVTQTNETDEDRSTGETLTGKLKDWRKAVLRWLFQVSSLSGRTSNGPRTGRGPLHRERGSLTPALLFKLSIGCF